MRPLDGLRVLDLSRVLAGPYCSMFLADLGAEVIKVERPGSGDDTRAFGPPFVAGESAYFMSINRGKKSLTLDLKQPEARDLLWRLVERSDILLENFRPGALGRLGFSAEALAQRNPRLILASISGYGQTGLPQYVKKPGYDVLVQGTSGLSSITGSADGPPTKFGVSITDLTSGLFALIGILAALHARERTGRGQAVDVSMLDGSVSLLTFQGGMYLNCGVVPQRLGNQHPSICPYETFSARDGYFNLAVGNDALWRTFCKATGREDLAADPELATNGQRVSQRDRLFAVLSDMFAQRPVAEWIELFEGAGVPCGPILKVDQALAHPQLEARGMIVETEHATAGKVRVTGTPIRFTDTPAAPAGPPPALGEHTDDILRGTLGLEEAQIAGLKARGVV